MPLRFVFIFVSAAALIFAQSEAPQGAAAKVSLPPPASAAPSTDAGVAQSTAPRPASAAAAEQTTQTPAPESAAPAAPKPAAVKPPPAASAKGSAEKTSSAGHKPYVFGPLDVILIKVYEQPTLSGPFAVSSDGFISMPVVGDVKADGLNATELKLDLTQRLKDCCFNNLQAGEVSVELGKNHSKRFYVFGGVGRPGEYPLDRDDLHVMEALSDVGGLHEFARKKKIRIQRLGQPKEFVLNYVDVSRGKHMEQDIVIQNGDRIFVDE